MITRTLAEFLLARIAEDEEAARGQIELREARYPGEAVQPGIGAYQLGGGWWLQVEPRHVLAECEAKRRTITRFVRAAALIGKHPSANVAHDVLRGVLLDMALPYADHEQFREEWRV